MARRRLEGRIAAPCGGRGIDRRLGTAPHADALRTPHSGQPLDAPGNYPSARAAWARPLRRRPHRSRRPYPRRRDRNRAQGTAAPRARAAARPADEEGNRLRPAESRATRRAWQEAFAAQAIAESDDLFSAHLLLEPLFSLLLGGVHPRGDRRDLFVDDRGYAPPVLCRP